MKLFERMIEQRLRSYLEDIGFINKYQSGFRQNKSLSGFHLARQNLTLSHLGDLIHSQRGGGADYAPLRNFAFFAPY